MVKHRPPEAGESNEAAIVHAVPRADRCPADDMGWCSHADPARFEDFSYQGRSQEQVAKGVGQY
ncbi:hypothetical protein, partial [Klebsiella pneumoniae]|uniref:hypothetical protein n=1 Tax=Klebsiella pneumoniae TaxID=573 RepID=UPI0023B19655